MAQHKVSALVAVLIALGHIVTGLNVSNKPVNDTVEVTSRSSRTEYPVYSPPDNYAPKKKPVPLSYSSTFPAEKDDGPINFSPETYSESSEETNFQPSHIPPAYYKSKPRYFSQESNFQKSGTNTNWNVWKDATEVPKPPSMKAPAPPPPPYDFEEYYLPADSWKGDPWTPDKMATMMMMMNQMKPKQSLLSGIFKDPLAALMVAILPISLILAAVLPSFANMMMNGGIPTITTTATGGKARGSEDFLSSPVVRAISTFGARALDNPGCMQRVFCQMTKSAGDSDSSAGAFRKAMHKVLRLVGEEHLEQFGIKDLVDSMLDGNCEKIPCLNFSSNDSPSENSKEVLKNIM
ncbi:hypothetical protein JTE90_015141 [Oedothorax gibbosus]|uniref:Uncharacterized protein n=1 Tax=Oedothorax gibbosus TaxID=931172 RepID=A0AAV6VQN3_9ARAC|nr:hypothetical protein JTE90_015141 [Oedothorax gibbosus]